MAQYRVPRFKDVPAIEIVLLDRRDLPSAGAGETPIVCVAPAIGSAARNFGSVATELPVKLVVIPPTSTGTETLRVDVQYSVPNGENHQMPYVLVLMTFLALQGAAPATTGNWPQWRGPSQDGVSRETGLPSSWGAKCLDGTGVQPVAAQASDPAAVQPQGRGRGGGREGRPIVQVSCSKMDTQNVAWKLPLPAYSGSTPIIWGNTIFLNMATASNTGALELWAIDRTNQTVLWKRPIADGNHMERKQNMSSPSPVTDGRTVWVMTGVGVLKAFDFGGKELWSRNIQADYGKFGLNWGYASSPLLRGDALYVQVLHGMKTDDPSYVMKIDAGTGKTIWRVERLTEAVSESPDSYTTPAWIEAGGRSELVTTGGDVVSAHDPATGKELWRADVLNPTRDHNFRIIASPTIVDGLIIAPTRNNPLVALRPGGSGDVASSHVAWTFAQGPDVPTPVSDGKLLYVVRDNGVVFALDVKTGHDGVWTGAPAAW